MNRRFQPRELAKNHVLFLAALRACPPASAGAYLKKEPAARVFRMAADDGRHATESESSLQAIEQG